MISTFYTCQKTVHSLYSPTPTIRFVQLGKCRNIWMLPYSLLNSRFGWLKLHVKWARYGCFSVFPIFNTFHQFSGFCVGRNFILCSIPDILGFEWVKSHEKWTSLFTPKKEKNEQVNTDGEKTEKWTSLLTLKRQKNEQVYWSWRDRKMNKFIAGKEREQGVTTVGPKK